ncbi:MAG: energy transducer TonB, partial [Mucilaginibacter sp.]
GALDNIKVVRGIGGGCDEAAVEALKKTSQPWMPGSQYGLPVRVEYSLPLTFSLKE